MGASTLAARWSRYVIDLNRPPEDTNLYPGQDTTGLCPVDTFGASRCTCRARRRARPRCSAAPRALLAALPRAAARRAGPPAGAARQGGAVGRALDRVGACRASSRASLPDLNFGTADGESCAPGLERRGGAAWPQAHGRYSIAVNGRFKGGHITRRYGQPARGRARDPARDVPVPVHGRAGAVRLPARPARERPAAAARR